MKPKVAVFDFASCEGCELQIANLEEEILEVLGRVEIVSFREVMKEHSDDYDVAFIEGSINRPIDEERLKNIRAHAKVLIAMGDCACTGCVNKLRNDWSVDDVKKEVYPDAAKQMKDNEFFDIFPTKAINEVVDVDFYIRGCPIRKEQFLYYVKRFAAMPPRRNMNPRFGVSPREMEPDERSIIHYDPQKCILCRHCHIICNDVLAVHAIGVSQKGNGSIISTPFNNGLEANNCIKCGQCLVNCPVGAFSEDSHIDRARSLLEDKKNHVIVVIDPIAMASAMEVLQTTETKLGPVIQKTISIFRALGAKKVLDFTNLIYLSIAAQGEFLRGNKEMSFASWCPSARIFVNKFYPQYKKNLHPEMEPSNIMVNLLRNRYGKKNLKIILVSPCIVHKDNPDIDAVLTARELSTFLKSCELDMDFFTSEGINFDSECSMTTTFLGGARNDYTYSLSILEAAYLGKFNNLNSALDVKTIGDYAHEITYDSEEGFFNALVIEDIAKTSKYLEKDIRKYNLVELYPCMDGCLTGGGQALTTSPDVLRKRMELLKEYKGIIKSHDKFIANMISAYESCRGSIL
ncbi:MAG: [Fe-Fe] hydrogenase large subunit C-terminal domain-containing protein [Thermoplasmata archaeon]